MSEVTKDATCLALLGACPFLQPSQLMHSQQLLLTYVPCEQRAPQQAMGQGSTEATAVSLA